MKIKSKFNALAGEYKDIAAIVVDGVPRWRKIFADNSHKSRIVRLGGRMVNAA